MITSSYYLRAFGAVSLEVNGVRATGAATQRKRLALQVLLCVAGDRGISRDKLLAYLWPEANADRARNALSQLLHGLRREHAGAFIATTDLVRIASDRFSSDLADFQAAIQREDWAGAIRLYSGPFLDGFFLKDCDEFERWADEHRRRFSAMYLSALERGASDASERGDHLTALRWWRQYAAAQPASARGALGVMNELVTGGDVSAAIEHARVHALMLRTEFETEPDPRVLALEARLRRGDVHVAAEHGIVVPPSHDTTRGRVIATEQSTAASSPLTGACRVSNSRAPSRMAWRDAWRRLPKRRSTAVVSAVILVIVVLTASRMRGLHARAPVRHDTQRVRIQLDSFSVVGDSQRVSLVYMIKEVVGRSLEQLNGVVVRREPDPLRPPDVYVVAAGHVASDRVSGGRVTLSVRLHGLGGVTLTGIDSATLALDDHLGDSLIAFSRRVQRQVARVVDPGFVSAMAPPPPFGGTAPSYYAYDLSRQASNRNVGGDVRGALALYSQAVAIPSSDWATPGINELGVLFALGAFDSLDVVAAGLRQRRLQPIDQAVLDAVLENFDGRRDDALHSNLQLLRWIPGSLLAWARVVSSANAALRPHLADSLLRLGVIAPSATSLEYWVDAYHMTGQLARALPFIDSVQAQGPRGARLSRVLYNRCRALAALNRPTDVRGCLAAVPSDGETAVFNQGEIARQVATEFAEHGNLAASRQFLAEALTWYRRQPPARLHDREFGMYYLQGLLDANELDAAERQIQLMSDVPFGALDSIALHGAQGIVAARRHNRERADQAASWLIAHPTRFTLGTPLIWLARIAEANGDEAVAVDYATKGLSAGFPVYNSPNIYDPFHQIVDLAPLIAYPQIRALVSPRD